jgi:hypothetical protein
MDLQARESPGGRKKKTTQELACLPRISAVVEVLSIGCSNSLVMRLRRAYLPIYLQLNTLSFLAFPCRHAATQTVQVFEAALSSVIETNWLREFVRAAVLAR